MKVTSRYPAIRRSRSRSRIPIKNFLKITVINNHLIKSLTAVYIPANTPRRERMTVKTGLDNPRTLSSLTPHHVITPIMIIIWNARPEYFPKSCKPLFSGFFSGFFWFFCFCERGCFIIFAFTHFAVSREFCSRFN